MAITPLLSSALGFPNPRAAESMVRAWETDPNMFRLAEELPMEDYPAEIIEWTSEFPVSGMTAAYALDTDPLLIKDVGRTEYKEVTAYWKESRQLNESHFLRTRKALSYNKFAGKELIRKHLYAGNIRLDTRIEWLRAQCLLNGQITINENGIVRTINYGIPPGHFVSAAVPWSDPNANIVGNLQAWINLFRGVARGGVKIRMNAITAQAMTGNADLKDLFRQNNTALSLGPGNIGKLIVTQLGDAYPVEFEIYDEGYTDDEGSFTPFVPDGKVSIVAKPPRGEKLGAFYTTPAISNSAGTGEPRPGKILGIKDRTGDAERPFYRTTHGIYGIPALFYPDFVVVATVF